MKLPETVKKKLWELPNTPGCYIMRDRFGKIIYVGKAASLSKRVRSYFRRGAMRSADPKLAGLVQSLADIEWIATRTEAEAILTEGRLIKEYKPRYNIAFRDDKRFLLLRINLNEPYPRIQLARIKRNDGATYLGPFASAQSARTLLKFATVRFGIRACRPLVPGPEDHRHCLDDIVKNCAAPCIGAVSAELYREKAVMAAAALSGQDREFIRSLELEMETASRKLDFERAAFLRDALRSLRMLSARARLALGARASDPSAGPKAVEELGRILGLKRPPRVIEAFDVSCIVGEHAVASMVSAVDGVPRPDCYRRFRIKTAARSDDPAMMAEAVSRRISRLLREGRTLPDLILVDGGLTQTRAARAAVREQGAATPVLGLAKRYEELYLDNAPNPGPLRLPDDSAALLLLRRIRDEAHRFAHAYHTRLRERRLRESALDEIPGIGKTKKQRLLRRFGSVAHIAAASKEEIAAVPGIGPLLAGLIKQAIGFSRARRRSGVCAAYGPDKPD